MVVPASKCKYQTTKDIFIPKGTSVVYVGRMRQEVERTAQAFIPAGPNMHYEWLMYFDDALKIGLIEKVE